MDIFYHVQDTGCCDLLAVDKSDLQLHCQLHQQKWRSGFHKKVSSVFDGTPHLPGPNIQLLHGILLVNIH